MAYTIEFKTTWATEFKLVHGFEWGTAHGRTKKFPIKWAWPRLRNPTIIGIRSTYLYQNYLSYWLQIWWAALTYHCYLTIGFCTLYCEAVRWAILATPWILVWIAILSNQNINYVVMCLFNLAIAQCKCNTALHCAGWFFQNAFFSYQNVPK